MDNGNITYQCMDGKRVLPVKTVRGIITAKRVTTYTRTWDHSGNRLTAYRPGMMRLRLLSFHIDGQPEVKVQESFEAHAGKQPVPATA